MVIYGDVIFFVNFISAIALFLGVKEIFSIKAHLWRVVLSGCVSGVYGVLEGYLSIPYLFRLPLLLLLSTIAFGYVGIGYNVCRTIAVESMLTLLCTLILSLCGYGGIVMSASVLIIGNPIVVMMILVCLYPLIWLGFRIWKKYRQIVTVTCEICNTKIRLRLLYDSGNILRYKGVAVAVVDWMAVKDIMGINSYNEAQITAEDRTIYNTVAGTGIMPLVHCKNTLIRGNYNEIYIGLTERKFRLCDGVMGDIN